MFDSGYGGDVVADYLSDELGIVEVVRVIGSQFVARKWKPSPDLSLF